MSQNTALVQLDCFENQLTELELSHNPALTELNCGSNQLSELDLSQNTALERLDCYENQLRSLDLSRSENIRWRGTAINTDIDGGAERNMGWVLGECKI